MIHKNNEPVMAGDGGYGLGTPEAHAAFVKTRNKSIANAKTKALVEKAFDSTIPYTWDSLDYFEVEKLMNKLVELTVKECVMVVGEPVNKKIKQHFGVEL